MKTEEKRSFTSKTKGQSALGANSWNKTKYGPVRIGPLFENGAPQRQVIGPGRKFVPLISSTARGSKYGLVQCGLALITNSLLSEWAETHYALAKCKQRLFAQYLTIAVVWRLLCMQISWCNDGLSLVIVHSHWVVRRGPAWPRNPGEPLPIRKKAILTS